ncbi:AAA family ATPase [Candidatus Dependentiae bacterium]|nr:AAA family ATPase [Candidatus Dependentiae bacterium]
MCKRSPLFTGRLFYLAKKLFSTLKALFESKRELFKGLWIDSSDYTWESYSVISLDFSTLSSSTPEELKKELIYDLESHADQFSIDISQAPSTPLAKLKGLITKLAKKNKIIILIDEYDHPIIKTIGDNELAKANLEILFSGIKHHLLPFPM